jgi:hypothetical protein
MYLLLPFVKEEKKQLNIKIDIKEICHKCIGVHWKKQGRLTEQGLLL